MASSATKMFTLISSDDERFEVAEAAANMSQTIRHMIEDGCADGGIPLHNVTGSILAKVLEYCNKHAATLLLERRCHRGGEGGTRELRQGVLEVDTDTLYDLLLAANYLEVKELLDLACQKVADMIKGKTPEQIRQTFGIKNDFSPEEQEEIKKENQWAFEE
ncbi:hypothetical protein HU200_042940 [Digitaria exilis]|uniref:SKP1-like protein n=1 Tax=Digitaria exilis TaxID=1010633 RepID=A0A835BBY2_9POAL|nr:hypothetical protein HU200_042940 [Digitaria exilis]CAB3471085.1 unnamed protein product [Digitaria exilis]